MKQVIVFRHGKQEDLGIGYTSWGIHAPLTEQGRKLMQDVARRHEDLLKKCDYFATSPLIRAQQSLFAMMETLGHQVKDCDERVMFVSGLWTPDPANWSGNYSTMDEIWRQKQKFVEAEGYRALKAIRGIAISIIAENHVLCTSHGGPLDAALATAKSRLGNKKAFSKMQDLQKGEGVIFIFDDDNKLIGVEELRLS